ncbi:fructose-bisphosphate aldolase class I, partial [Candidatus Woesearchaeota archaeon]|nr:fructose-bisphosphate aldolase class I [Candidatus Woesearchaeota archaeon]
MSSRTLQEIAKAMVAKGRGILAMDESSGTIEKRFKEINVENNEKNRWAYRRLLITAEGLGNFISGAILFDETIRQKDADGTPFPEILKRQGIIPGIKVDKGAKELALFPGETVTEGLDGLRERLLEYRQLGAQFAKWRAVITIGSGIPTDSCIAANAHALARYAALCQEAGIVPIVEPEVLMDADNTIEVCYDVTNKTLKKVFEQLREFKV